MYNKSIYTYVRTLAPAATEDWPTQVQRISKCHTAHCDDPCATPLKTCRLTKCRLTRAD